MATTKRIQKSRAVKGKTDRKVIVQRSRREAVAAASPAKSDQPNSDAAFRAGTRGAVVVSLLREKEGATIGELTEATGWQAHSVRGFLSGSLKKKHGIAVVAAKGDDGQRRYRIAT